MSSRSEPRKHSRGAVATEAALVTPLLLLIVFGIIEMASLMRDNAALESLAEQGVRAAAAHADAYAADDEAPGFARYAADAVAEAKSAIPKGTIAELWVYRPNQGGYPCTAAEDDAGCAPREGDDNRSWTCAADCLRFDWNSSTHRFDLVSGSWPSTDWPSTDCPAAGDEVGVYLRAEHSFFATPLLRPTGIRNNAVLSFGDAGDALCGQGGLR
ncbi:TadE family protein [Nocardioides sp.]|uniref:TadE family protein n=1 Tax=Nocardioides sp. TaxID=35761 RepID=UPI0039E318E2